VNDLEVEADHKKTYQELLEKKNPFVFYQIGGRYIRCYVLPVID
jgi:hypothetical protein